MIGVHRVAMPSLIDALLVATKVALDELDILAGEEWTRDETVERMRALYEYRKRRFTARAGKIEEEGYEDRSPTSRWCN